MANHKMIVTVMLIALAALAGCSDDNPTTLVTPIDTAPPAVPANLSVYGDATAATLSWDMSTVDPDLAGYVVSREHYGAMDTLTDGPRMIDAYVDANPRPGNSQYHVYAVDTSGNMSAVASAALYTPHGKPADRSGNE